MNNDQGGFWYYITKVEVILSLLFSAGWTWTTFTKFKLNLITTIPLWWVLVTALVF